MSAVNPIAKIIKITFDSSGTATEGATTLGTAIKQPTSYRWGEEDLSRADAGRTINWKMHKEKVGSIEKLELSWKGLTTAEISAILTAFDGEYFKVNFLSPKAGAFVDKYFYLGNRNAPLYNATLGLWDELSFNMIQQDINVFS